VSTSPPDKNSNIISSGIYLFLNNYSWRSVVCGQLFSYFRFSVVYRLIQQGPKTKKPKK
jgi:phospholipase C